MKNITFGGMALVLATLFGMIQYGAPVAFALPATGTQLQKNQPKYRIRTLPGLTGPAHKKAKKKINKSFLKNQVFLGTIAKMNRHYVLTAGIFTYKLNDQTQASKFNGKNVRVTGKLNPQTNKIDVKNLKKAGG